MFILKDFIKENLVNGVKNNAFAKEYANILAVNYLAKGMLGETDVKEVSDGIEATTITATDQTATDTTTQADANSNADDTNATTKTLSNADIVTSTVTDTAH